MSEENKKESHNGLFLVMAVAIAIPLLYVLSIGPAAFIVTKYPKYGHVFREFYFPLIWLAIHAGLGESLRQYIKWWM